TSSMYTPTPLSRPSLVRPILAPRPRMLIFMLRGLLPTTIRLGASLCNWSRVWRFCFSMKSPPKTLREMGTSWALSSRRRAVTTTSSIERLALGNLCWLFSFSSANELPAARVKNNTEARAVDAVGTVEGNFCIAGGIVRESPERQRLHGIAHNHLLHDGMSSVMQSAESRWIDNENIKE